MPVLIILQDHTSLLRNFDIVKAGWNIRWHKQFVESTSSRWHFRVTADTPLADELSLRQPWGT